MIDKSCILQIFGSLMKKPQLLGEVDKYHLDITDFSSRFEKIIYAAIYGLYDNGAKLIHPIDIENYLETNSTSKVIFKQERGIEYLQDAEELSQIENFSYYYDRLKKFNLLKSLQKIGISTDDFYISNLTDPKALEVNQNFENISIADIITKTKKKLIKVESEYLRNDVTETQCAVDGIEEMLEDLKENPEIGLPLQGEIFNEIISGARRGTFYIRSAGSGTGKSRSSVGDACYLAYPLRYSVTEEKWVWVSSSNEKILYIATEQDFKEIRTMILAYLTGMNETKIRYNRMSENEQRVLEQAIWVMKQYKENFRIVRMPNPTIELVKTIIRENNVLYGVNYIFYDYIFICPSILHEFKGFNLRNDELLLMFSTALKDLAVELNAFVMSSTQLNAKGDDNKDIRNEGTLAGGRSTINKADVGAVMARPTKDELEILKPFTDKYGITPNLVTDIYKIRAGQYNQVRIWSYIDLGNLRKKDLYATDARFEEVPGFLFNENFIYDEEQEQFKTQLDFLNDGVITDDLRF